MVLSFQQQLGGLIVLLWQAQVTLQQDDDSDNNSSCSFISGEGCMNGVCKFCAMCLPSVCILATPYSTGDNDGSTCAVTNQSYGYDFYNYCLSSGLSNNDNYNSDDDDSDGGDDDGDECNTSTACYPYRQGDSAQQHVWTNLTCSDSCQLIMNNGSPPPVPIPITNITTVTNTHHPSPGTTSSGNVNPHRSPFDPRTKSPTSIALISVCSIVSFLLVIWLVRIVFYKSRYWPWINRYLCCGFCHPPVKHLPTESLLTSINSNTMSASSAQPDTTSSRPPSFQSNRQQHTMSMRQYSIHSHNSSYASLPSYHCQDPSLPKYEQAIVTQIRGMSFFDHHPSSAAAAATSASASSGQQQQQQQQQPIWIPIYLSSSSVHNSTIVSSPVFNSFLASNSDWARPPNTRHQPHRQSSSQSSLSIRELCDQEQEQQQEATHRPQLQ